MILKIEGEIEVLLIQVEVQAVQAVVHQALVPLLLQVVQHPHLQDLGQDHYHIGGFPIEIKSQISLLMTYSLAIFILHK